MTRINLLPPHCLSMKHLVAEYREITRVFTNVLTKVRKGVTLSDCDIPPKFRLGKGHETFFHNKISFVAKRYNALHHELVSRGGKPDRDLFIEVNESLVDIPQEWWGEYTPKPEDIYLSMARNCIRSRMYPVIELLFTELGIPNEN